MLKAPLCSRKDGLARIQRRPGGRQYTETPLPDHQIPPGGSAGPCGRARKMRPGGAIGLFRTQEYAAHNRGEEYDRRTYATEEIFVLSRLSCWEHLSPEQYRQRVAELVEEIELAARGGSARERTACPGRRCGTPAESIPQAPLSRAIPSLLKINVCRDVLGGGLPLQALRPCQAASERLDFSEFLNP
jgi:hypothetical protein